MYTVAQKAEKAGGKKKSAESNGKIPKRTSRVSAGRNTGSGSSYDAAELPRAGSARPPAEDIEEDYSVRRRNDEVPVKTEIRYYPGYYYYDHDEGKEEFKHRVTVGKDMCATLINRDKKEGSQTNGSAAHNHLMAYLKNKWDSSMVRGHLLNDHLGGPAVEENLFPISSGANSAHLSKVEKYVKGYVYTEPKAEYVKYEVHVRNEKGETEFNECHPKTYFECKVEPLDVNWGAIRTPVKYKVWSDISNNSTDKRVQTAEPGTVSSFDPNDPHSGNKGGWGTGDHDLERSKEQNGKYTLRRDGEILGTVYTGGKPYKESYLAKPGEKFSRKRGWGHKAIFGGSSNQSPAT